MARAEAIRRLEGAQIAWGRLTEMRDLPGHPALRRMTIALPSGRRIKVPRPAGRDDAGNTLPAVPAVGADTERIRREFAA